jgi:hypothetical protein
VVAPVANRPYITIAGRRGIVGAILESRGYSVGYGRVVAYNAGRV